MIKSVSLGAKQGKGNCAWPYARHFPLISFLAHSNPKMESIMSFTLWSLKMKLGDEMN